ncbi:hypothetical protein CMV_007106 [Castanea mollissima]|uniref:RNase H type-1 domain-containing protein n=1 Tax=Castanea mollissima TaxID=60419 RepID=A0A8J4RLD1_9ROSI|nr:hypothetical protein CMV_007106 [Castanea mollissima]
MSSPFMAIFGLPFLLIYPQISRRAFKLSHSLLQLGVLIGWLGKGPPKVSSAQRVLIDLLYSLQNQLPFRVCGYGNYVPSPRFKCLFRSACTIVWGFVKPIWQHLGQQKGTHSFYSQGIRDWLVSNAKDKASHNSDGVPWNIILPFALWLIWKQRNQVLNLSSVIIELDAKALVDALNNPAGKNTVISPLFDDCKQLASQIPRLVFRHIYREANSCANQLANIGRIQCLDFVLYTNPPLDLVHLLEADCQGVCTERRCLDSLFCC